MLFVEFLSSLLITLHSFFPLTSSVRWPPPMELSEVRRSGALLSSASGKERQHEEAAPPTLADCRLAEGVESNVEGWLLAATLCY
jgi:hypothetical protein